jgi:nuclease HARBI1
MHTSFTTNEMVQQPMCGGFIEGTLQQSYQPSEEQLVYCSGHKHNHSIKFQAVVTPDVPGSRHYFPPGQPNYAIYGDSAYAQCRVLIVGFGYPLPNSCEAQWNTEMSKVREGVEWMFGRIATLWKTTYHQTS